MSLTPADLLDEIGDQNEPRVDFIIDTDGEILQEDGIEWATGNRREIPRKKILVGMVWKAVE